MSLVLHFHYTYIVVLLNSTYCCMYTCIIQSTCKSRGWHFFKFSNFSLFARHDVRCLRVSRNYRRVPCCKPVPSSPIRPSHQRKPRRLLGGDFKYAAAPSHSYPPRQPQSQSHAGRSSNFKFKKCGAITGLPSRDHSSGLRISPATARTPHHVWTMQARCVEQQR